MEPEATQELQRVRGREGGSGRRAARRGRETPREERALEGASELCAGHHHLGVVVTLSDGTRKETFTDPGHKAGFIDYSTLDITVKNAEFDPATGTFTTAASLTAIEEGYHVWVAVKGRPDVAPSRAQSRGSTPSIPRPPRSSSSSSAPTARSRAPPRSPPTKPGIQAASGSSPPPTPIRSSSVGLAPKSKASPPSPASTAPRTFRGRERPQTP